MKTYTHNWNGYFVQNTQGLKNLDLCLEIGCFEGLTSNYIIDNLLSENGKLICVDPLTDFYLNDNLTEEENLKNRTEYSYFNNQFERFKNNVSEFIEKNKLELIRKLSSEAFPELIKNYKNSFDLIYIDGDHRPDSVYIDAINSFNLCKNGGFILFDDYKWHDTYKGIDRFMNEYDGCFEVLIKEYQVLLKKIIQ